MLLNFCDPRLRPEIQCTTVSTEGHEVTNLISNSDKGFLAYSCIKPPVNIDITFICNICIHHILIWPYVGSQKSSGFQLYAKTTTDASVPYDLLSTGYLNHSDSGLLVYPSSINHEVIPSPPNFLKRYIKSSKYRLTSYMNSLRICICKTENSVPAVGKIEVWGTVSPRCGKDTVASIHTLWFKQQTSVEERTIKVESADSTAATFKNRELLGSSLEIPECFLDSITWEIMTQPIMLPSGKVIDQSTLQKHEESEAIWGRVITDPFTGIPFNEHRKPVRATALKMRIDKFLLENSNAEEIKKLPRVLGRALPSAVRDKKVVEIPKCVLKENGGSKGISELKPKAFSSATNEERSKHCHKLPVSVICSKRTVSDMLRSAKRRRVSNASRITCEKVQDNKDNDKHTDTVDVNIQSNSDIDINTIVPDLKRFNVTPEDHKIISPVNNCNCCTNGIFYELPCKHVLCRKILTSIENNQCTSCGSSYKNSEVKRIHE